MGSETTTCTTAPADHGSEYVEEPTVETLSHQGGATVQLYNGQLIYKFGHRVKENEFHAMKLVSEHTSIPVPRVTDWAQFNKTGFLVMSFIPGKPLSESWDSMPSQSRHSIVSQLKGHLTQLRQIPKPAECNGAFVCGAMGGPVSTEVPIPGRQFTGPFADDLTFRKAIGDAYFATAGRRYTPAEVTAFLPSSSKSVLTHCDFVPRNILVDGEKVTGIIDWEFSGWYPDYWEFSLTMNRSEIEDLNDFGAWVPPLFTNSFIEMHETLNRVRHVLF
ncbi:kinase-like domain-containing protein [Sparassis latifolia]|uniref:Phosphotransferase family protein n=1 Tax=Sparassis crispa TaxID=139825 RepID=A0A401GXL0_9APHY|nr:Phosphotransferase family protein [Sparassis crispa]GBE86968.1 Phosphotransferase family protein [Sparassis crispa]